MPCRFFLASNSPTKAAREQRDLLKAVLGSQGGENAIKQFFYEKTRELMQGESCRSVGTSVHTVDIVRDVLKVVPLHWACGLVSAPGDHSAFRPVLSASRQAGIRLKTKADDDGDYTAQELFNILADIYT